MAYTAVATASGDTTNTGLSEALLTVYSLDIQHAALGVTRFAEFAVKKTELGTLPGQTITFTKYANLTLGGSLSEENNMTLQALDASQSTLTVTEYGNAVGVTEKLLRLSWDDVLSEAALLLGRDFGVVLDTELRDAALDGASSEIFAGDKASGAALETGDVMDIEVIRDCVETLQTANAPKFNGDFYISFLHPHQSASLKRDPDWVSANNYANTRALFNGELGRWEDVVFIGTTHMNNGAAAATAPGYDAALASAGADSQDLYEGIVFGDAYLAWAEALPVEMRESGVIDFGRKHGLAWYSIMGFGTLYDDYGVKFTTS